MTIHQRINKSEYTRITKRHIARLLTSLEMIAVIPDDAKKMIIDKMHWLAQDIYYGQDSINQKKGNKNGNFRDGEER